MYGFTNNWGAGCLLMFFSLGFAAPVAAKEIGYGDGSELRFEDYLEDDEPADEDDGPSFEDYLEDTDDELDLSREIKLRRARRRRSKTFEAGAIRAGASNFYWGTLFSGYTNVANRRQLPKGDGYYQGVVAGAEWRTTMINSSLLYLGPRLRVSHNNWHELGHDGWTGQGVEGALKFSASLIGTPKKAGLPSPFGFNLNVGVATSYEWGETDTYKVKQTNLHGEIGTRIELRSVFIKTGKRAVFTSSGLITAVSGWFKEFYLDLNAASRFYSTHNDTELRAGRSSRPSNPNYGRMAIGAWIKSGFVKFGRNLVEYDFGASYNLAVSYRQEGQLADEYRDRYSRRHSLGLGVRAKLNGWVSFELSGKYGQDDVTHDDFVEGYLGFVFTGWKGEVVATGLGRRVRMRRNR